MQAQEPIDVVRAFYEARAAGRESLEFVGGRLLDFQSIAEAARDHVEGAAPAVELRRLDLTRDDGVSAVVRIDVTTRAAYRHYGGVWKAASSRVRGDVRLERIEGSWRIVDLPSPEVSRGRLFSVEHEASDGDVRLTAEVVELPRASAYYFIVANGTPEAISVDRLYLGLRALRWLPFEGAMSLRHEAKIAPAGRWGAAYGWGGAYRTAIGFVEIRTLDVDGRVHSARVSVSPPRQPPFNIRLGRFVKLAPALEWIAALWLIPNAIFGLSLVSYIPGACLLAAAAVRGSYLVSFVRLGARGTGLAVVIALVFGEAIGGSVLVLLSDLSWGAASVLVTATFLLVQGSIRLMRPIARE